MAPFSLSFNTGHLNMSQQARILSSLLCALLVAGCALIPTPEARRDSARALAASQGWRMQALPVQPFALAAFFPPNAVPADRLTVYLEGDGMAWTGPSRISEDPTPVNPMALRLALAQPAGAVAYLGRPCQYVFAAACEASYWTARRFAPEVVSATSDAIDVLKKRFGARELTLVGYSGGGAVAMLVAARRQDVVRVVTVAGNLDHRAWTSLHRLDPLRGSLNPADDAPSSRRFVQWHLAGEKDAVVPHRLIEDFAGRYAKDRPSVRVVPGFDHQCCWVEAWPGMWNNFQEMP